MIFNDIHWFLKDRIVFSMNFNDFPVSFNVFYNVSLISMIFLCFSIVFIDFQIILILLFNAYYFEMIFNEFLDFQWFSYVLHRFPNPFKLLLVSIVIFNVFCFHRFLMILICFSLFLPFTTSIWYGRRSGGLSFLPRVSIPTFNDMRACHDMPNVIKRGEGHVGKER